MITFIVIDKYIQLQERKGNFSFDILVNFPPTSPRKHFRRDFFQWYFHDNISSVLIHHFKTQINMQSFFSWHWEGIAAFNFSFLPGTKKKASTENLTFMFVGAFGESIVGILKLLRKLSS